MLKIDFDSVFKNLDAQKTTSLKSNKKRRNSLPSQAIQLGNEEALSDLPEKVNGDFLEMYNETIDNMLYPYVAQGRVSISYASKYGQTIIENIFGNEEHLGIYHYLKDKDIEGVSDKHIVSYAEKLLLQGWYIKEENSKYWLYNSNLEKVIDLTGNAEESIEADALSFEPENAHLMFDDITASKIYALAEQFGYNADELSKINNLELLLSKTENVSLEGYLTNFGCLKTILEKRHSYRTLTQGTSLFDMYNDNYRLSDTLVPKGVVLTNNESELLLFPTEGDMGETFLFNKGLLGMTAQELRKQIYAPFNNIRFQEVLPIKDMRHVFAFTSELIDNQMTRRSYFESENVLKRADQDEIKEALAVVVVTESILLGNEWFNSTCFGFDSVSNSFYVYFNKDAFTRSDLENLTEPAKYSIFSYSYNALDYMKDLPAKYKTAIQDADIDTSELDVELNSVRDYFNSAKEMILREFSS